MNFELCVCWYVAKDAYFDRVLTICFFALNVWEFEADRTRYFAVPEQTPKNTM